MAQTPRKLEYYRRLAYTLHREPARDSDGSIYWIAEYLELRGCKTDGKTEVEAVPNLQELFDEYVLARIESNIEIPEPVQPPDTVEESWIELPPEILVQNTQETRAQLQYETHEAVTSDSV